VKTIKVVVSEKKLSPTSGDWGYQSNGVMENIRYIMYTNRDANNKMSGYALLYSSGVFIKGSHLLWALIFTNICQEFLYINYIINILLSQPLILIQCSEV